MNHASRILYSTDASIYQQLPLAVVKPLNNQDCIQVMQFAHRHKIPVIPRAGGTSLAGQVVGEAIIIDVSRYMTRFLSINEDEQTAEVEAGVIIESLNQRVKQKGLKFAPDPSTLNRCTISGVIGNNAWGAHAPIYGSTRDHIIESEIILSNGEVITTKPLSKTEFDAKLKMPSIEGKIYRLLDDTIKQHGKLILDRYPDKKEIICNAGYALHEIVTMQPWNTTGPKFNLTALLCGSEGTLGLATKAKVKLCSSPQYSMMVGVHFNSIEQALLSVPIALEHQACAVELLDDYLLTLTKHNKEQSQNRFWIKGDPKSVLVIEFYGEHVNTIKEQCNNLIQALKAQNLGYEYTVVNEDKVQQVWSLRRAALGLLMGMLGRKKAVSFIEDSAVPVKHLADFVNKVQILMYQHKTECVYYGSVSKGLIHLRPLLDLHQKKERDLFSVLAQKIASLLMDYGGTISAKHGDGIVRSAFIEKFFGQDIVHCQEQIKFAFDPHNLLNPGKIVHPGPTDRNLRYQDDDIKVSSTGFHWHPDGIFNAAEKCNGAGACRKIAGSGTMCPSYMATGEELHCTRGRANTIRQALQENNGFNKASLQVINDSLKICLSCKGCRSECPANVDMAKLKAESLHQTRKISGLSYRTKILSMMENISRVSSHMPRAVNTIIRLPFINQLLGFSPKRKLPRFAAKPFSTWFENHTPKPNAGTLGKIVLLNDLFIQYYEMDLGRCTVELLELCGYEIILAPCFGSARLDISLGLLDRARHKLQHAIDWLSNNTEDAKNIIGIEPSELLSYRDEAPDLVSSSQQNKLEALQGKILLFEEFISENQSQMSHSIVFKNDPINIALHAHCHQKSLSDMEACINALRTIPQVNIQTIPSGCCGMAGFFGYEKQNYQLSKSIGELVLFPAIRNLPDDTKIVATGASCRQQIGDFLQRRAYHPVEIIHQMIDHD